MKKKYLLPELDCDISIEAVDTHECWNNRGKAYDFLLDHLCMDYESTESVFDGGSSGIPHIYEQMILFTEAFYDPQHQDHKRAVQEWRSVLMLMAFRRIKNLNLDMVKVDLTGNSKNRFICAAADFVLDDPPVLYQTTWDFLYVLLLEDDPIAILSPTTLVCPAKQFKKRINQCKMDWLQFDRVNKVEQPILKFSEMGHEYSCLTEWLRRLQGELYNADDTATINARYEYLMKEVSAFIEHYAHGKYPESPSIFQEHIYDEMNSSLRTEYHFLNFCCDFEVSNKKMKFLERKYTPDIFQNKLMLLVYDRKQDAMFNRENLLRLRQIIAHIMEVNQRKIISVTESGGEELPIFALLPFHKQFICELVEREISPDEFFASYQVVYNKAYDRMEISLSIKEFPFSYQKNYERDQWEIITGQDVLPIYLWPKEQLSDGWKAYYVYSSCDKQKMTLDVPYKGAQLTKYDPPTGGGGNTGSFQLIESETFPSYLRLIYRQVSGYLPVKTLNADLHGAGATAQIYLDVGHTNTNIAIVIKGGGDPPQKPQRIGFHKPSSVWVSGSDHENSGVYDNFLAPSTKESTKNLYFKSMLHDLYPYHRLPNNHTVRPFKDGHIIFDGGVGGDTIVSMINFDYAKLTERDRKRVHIYLEQILLYVFYEAVLAKCIDVEVKFLHMSRDEQLGELKGLWQHALEQVKGKTGVRCWQPHALECMDELQALAHHLCLTLLQEQRITHEHPSIPSSKLYVSVDIGWKKTLVAALDRLEEQGDGLVTQCVEIPFAGKDISMVDKGNAFHCYTNLLSLLLGGPYKIDPNTEEGALLTEFGKLYKIDPSNEDYYYGLFDLIALKIEQNHFEVPPDIYNNLKEFRQLIHMLTYNILLLFFEIGCALSPRIDDQVRDVQIFLGGNGSKFLNWIVNWKNFSKTPGFNKITNENCHELFIVPLQNTILDVVRQGLQINRFGAGQLVEGTHRHIDCTISMVDDPKNQLIEGYIFHETPDLFFENGISPRLQLNPLTTRLEQNYSPAFLGALHQITRELFADMEFAFPSEGSTDSIDMTVALQTWSQATCKAVIAQICRK